MNEYPLLFTIREIVEGPGYVAGVVCDGRALMVKEGDEEWHVSGVEPGGLSELGTSELEAYCAFRQSFTHALKVFASDAYSFEAFESTLKSFCAYKDAEDEQRWQAARKQVQAGAEVEGPFKELPKEKAEEPRGVRVVRLDYQAKAADQKEAARSATGVPFLRGPGHHRFPEVDLRRCSSASTMIGDFAREPPVAYFRRTASRSSHSARALP